LIYITCKQIIIQRLKYSGVYDSFIINELIKIIYSITNKLIISPIINCGQKLKLNYYICRRISRENKDWIRVARNFRGFKVFKSFYMGTTGIEVNCTC
jgi:hypothetical protein